MIPQSVAQFNVDNLRVTIFDDRDSMGQAAAQHCISFLQNRLESPGDARIVVGSAPSQDEFFEHFTALSADVDWSRIVVFHMDEYVGLPADHPQNFRRYQRDHLLARVSPGAFHEIRGEATDVEAECARLTDLLTEMPIDMVCLGIGENGHLAFNDPPADFSDSKWVKVVELDDVCRQQQVNDGCFESVDDVPTHAITLSLRVFQMAQMLSGVVPALSKADAVVATVEGPISETCPATLLRKHPNASLFLDTDAASKFSRRQHS